MIFTLTSLAIIIALQRDYLRISVFLTSIKVDDSM